MVAKEIDPFKSQHDYEQAGQTALERVAGNLKLTFTSLPKNLESHTGRIFNGLRFEQAKYAIQIDHLILHQYGIILIENRGEPADISVNAIGEWTQIYKGKLLRISSPLTQGERKLTFLKTLLEQHAAVLRPSLKKAEGLFNDVSFDLLVTIADTGDLSLSPGMSLPRVCRAQDVGKKVIELMLQHKSQAKRGLFKRNLEKELSGDELFKLTGFLKQQHTPLERESFSSRFIKEDHQETDAPAQTAETASEHKIERDYLFCKTCGGSQLYIDHQGEYRVVCLDCGGIMVIDRTCSNCKRQGFVSRNGNDYFVECEACLNAELIFVDPVR